MRFDPGNPDWGDRDRFIMSKGHASPAVYSILRDLDVLSDSDLDGFRSMGSVCQGHVDRKWTKGVDFSAGSLGMGLSFGLGSATHGYYSAMGRSKKARCGRRQWRRRT